MVLYRKIYRWITTAIILLTLLGLSQAALAQSPAAVLVRVIPPGSQAEVGQFVDVAVEVVEVSNLYAIDVLMSFDPQVLQVVDQDPELAGVQVQLGTLLEPGFVVLNLVDNDLGRLRLAMTQLNPAPPKSGTGAIVVVRFLAKAAGPPSTVAVLQAKFSSPTGVEIPVGSLVSGQVEIVQTLAGPTSTSIPAQDPGTPMPTQAPPTSAGQQQTAPTFPPLPTPDYLRIQATPTGQLPPTATAMQPATQAASATAQGEQAATPTAQPLSAGTATPEAPATSEPVQASEAAPQLESTGDSLGPQKATALSQAGSTPTAVLVVDEVSEPEGSQSAAITPWILLLVAGLAAGALLAVAGIAAYLLRRRKEPGS